MMRSKRFSYSSQRASSALCVAAALRGDCPRHVSAWLRARPAFWLRTACDKPGTAQSKCRWIVTSAAGQALRGCRPDTPHRFLDGSAESSCLLSLAIAACAFCLRCREWADGGSGPRCRGRAGRSSGCLLAANSRRRPVDGSQPRWGYSAVSKQLPRLRWLCQPSQRAQRSQLDPALHRADARPARFVRSLLSLPDLRA